MIAYKAFRVDPSTGLLLPVTPVGEVVKHKVTGSRFYEPGKTYRTKLYPFMGFRRAEDAFDFLSTYNLYTGEYLKWEYWMCGGKNPYGKVFAVEATGISNVLHGLQYDDKSAQYFYLNFSKSRKALQKELAACLESGGCDARIAFTKFTILGEAVR